MRRAFYWSLLLPCLTGCFLDQKEPLSGVTPAGPTPYVGIMVLEDVSGHHEEAQFYAGFGKREEARAISSRSALAARAIEAPASRASVPTCEFRKGPLQSGRAATTYVNVGTMGFGPALQGELLAISPNEKNLYLKALAPNLPATIYDVSATGSGEFQKFGDLISLPEDIGAPTANRIRFEDGLPLIKGTGITLEWDRSSIVNDQNQLLVQFLAQTDTELYDLSCYAVEAAFGVQTARLSWELPQEHLAKFPNTGAAALFFTRAHGRQAASQQLELRSQGLRTAVMQAVVFTP